MPLVRGRVFTDADDAETPKVVVANKAMMRYWDGGDPIGSRISFDGGQSWSTIVGIVGDVKQFGLDKPAVAQVYTPLKQTTTGLGGLLLLRANSDPAAAAALIREAVRALDPDLPVARVRTLDDIRESYLATPKLTALLLAIFAALALLVTVAGITGVIATSVSQRTQEFGVRMALGASRQTVLRMVVGEGLALVGVGLAVGAIAALAATRVLPELSVRHDADRSDRVRRRRDGVGRRGRPRVPRPRVAGDDGRSNQRAPRRVAETPKTQDTRHKTKDKRRDVAISF